MPRAKTVFLHIGQDKTGSSAIQTFLRRNCAALNERDYDLVGGRVMHHGPLHTALLNGDREPLQATVDYIRQSPHANHVISYEGFYHLDDEMIARLLQALQAFRVVVVLYLRRRSDKFLSGLAQNLKHHRPEHRSAASQLAQRAIGDIDPIAEPGMDYLGIVRRWQALLAEHGSDDGLVLRVYEKSSLAEGDLLTDFGRAIQLLEPGETITPATFKLEAAPVNQSISPTAQYLNLFAQLLEPTREQQRELLTLMTESDDEDAGRLSLVPDHVAEALDAHYASDDKVLALEFVGRETLFREARAFRYAEPSGEDFIRLITDMTQKAVLKALVRAERNKEE